MRNEFQIVYRVFRSFIKDFLSQIGECMEGNENHIQLIKNMTAVVNIARDERDLPSLSSERIKVADTYASGHSDYVDTFALYCANLAICTNFDKSGHPWGY
jgi:hypothetical protein